MLGKDYDSWRNELVIIDRDCAITMEGDAEDREVIGDGPLVPEAYFHAPIRVLWLIKEPYDEEEGKGGGWHFAHAFASINN